MSELPLMQTWERVAMKDLVETLHLLSTGSFQNPQEYAERLQRSSEAIGFGFSSLSPSDPLGWIEPTTAIDAN